MKPIIFDIDGVFADFTLGFTELGHVAYGTSKLHTHEQKFWEDFGGMTKEQIAALWTLIDTNPAWWGTLPEMPHEPMMVTRIHEFSRRAPLYFVTSRKDHTGQVARITRDWLARRWAIWSPNVICSSHKGDLAKALNAGYLIDDKVGNVLYTTWATDGRTKAYLMDRPCNQLDSRGIGSSPPLRVKTLEEFLDIVGG